MTEETTTQTEEGQTPGPASAETENADTSGQGESGTNHVPYARFREINDKYRQAEARLAELERERQEREQAELTEREEYRTLYEREKEARESLERELEAERLNNLRQRIGSELQLPAPLIARLQGTTEEEIRADAESLRDALPRQKAPDVDSDRQRSDYTLPDKPFSQWSYEEMLEAQQKDPEAFARAARGG